MSPTRVLFLLLSCLVGVLCLESSSPGQEGQQVTPTRRRQQNGTGNGLTSTTIVARTFERVLMRRKRFLIFPVGANIVCTLAAVKGLVFKGPKGYNLQAEVDYFYPLPDSVAALKPKRTKLKAVTTPPPPPPTTTTEEAHPPFPEEELDENQLAWAGQQHPELFAPDSGWRLEPNLGQLSDVPPGKEVPAKERVWSPGASTTPFDPKLLLQSYGNWKDAGWTNYDQPERFQPQLQRIDYFPQGRSLKNEGGAQKGQEQTPVARRRRDTKEAETWPSSDWTQHEDWEHYQAHRDRRDLYKSLEGMISGINLQPCLMRTICEAQHFLLPKGKSLFHDIFKILFTLPIKDEFSDGYAETMRAKAPDCFERYAKDCPISILHMFLNSEKVL